MRQRRKTHRRGRTNPGRLRLLDQLLLDEAGLLPARQRIDVVDVGFGDSLVTSLAWASTLVTRFEVVALHGVESDAVRVQKARKSILAPNGSEILTQLGHSSRAVQLSVHQGGFALRNLALPHVDLVRCMNVLRGYGLEQVKPAHTAMLEAVADGGLLLEGTTNAEGSVLAAHLWQRQGLSVPVTARYLGLALGIDLSRGFAPIRFRDVLPRDLRRHFYAGEPIFEWIEAWQARVTKLRAERRFRCQAQLWDASLVGHPQAKQVTLRFPEDVEQGLNTRLVLWTPPTPSHRAEVLQSAS